jgi:integrase
VNHPRLFWRNGTAYFRPKYPADLKHLFTSEQRWVSLRTRCKCEALRKVKVADVAFDAEMDALRRAGRPVLQGSLKPVERLSPEESQHLAETYFASILRGDEYRRKLNAEERRAGFLGEDQKERHQDVEAVRASAAALLADGEVDDFTLSEIDVLLAGQGKKLTTTRDAETTRLELAHKLMEAAHRAYTEIRKRDSGEWVSSPELPQSKITLDDLIDRYLADPKVTRTAGTLKGYRIIFDVLREIVGGDRPAASISRDDCVKLRDTLIALPSNARKKFPGVPLLQTIELGRAKAAPTLAPLTVNGYLNNLAALFNWAEMNWHVARNPAHGLQVEERQKPQHRRLPLPLDKLPVIFNAPLYVGCIDDRHGYMKPGPNRPRRGRFWIPLLSLFHGLRMTEACQLLVTDVREIEGVWCLVIAEDDDEADMDDADRKRVKTDAGERFVPIHPEVLAMGFIGFVERQRAGNHARLFPEIEKSKAKSESDKTFAPFSKWFSRFLTMLGVKTKNATLHSLRHNFRDALDRAEASRAQVMALGGWEAVKAKAEGHVSDIYGSGPNRALGPRRLFEVMKKVNFAGTGLPDGLDLRHLHQKLSAANAPPRSPA